MGKLFGTDGIRGIAPTELTPEIALKLGASTARILKNTKKMTFLIGSDTRISRDILKMALATGLMSGGADVIDLGIIPTPAISYLIKKYNASGGFVISASHNPSEYNGIKVFNSEGFKLADDIEDKIEEIMLEDFKLNLDNIAIGNYKVEMNAKKDYVDFLIKTVDFELPTLKVGIDTANGASFETAKMLFDKLNIKYEIINDEPNGLNINDNCGSTHIEALRKLVISKKLDCGFAFDGDADRCLLIDEKGNFVDGDKIMAIYAKYLKSQGKLQKNTLVGTVMSNLGLIKFCENENILFEATKVGDRYVLENMLSNDYVIGGEQSGHIIFRKFANTGDGELTAIQILNVMLSEKKKLSELASVMETYPQVLKNVNVSKEKKEEYLQNEKINKILKDYENLLGGDGRILVRASGTENLIRVMIEGKNIETITKMCDDIVDVIKEELC